MGTQIVFLFGRPGVGKLTVGELLAADTGYRLLHNHAVVDLVTSLFSFGSPPFVALREKLWLDAVDACIAAKQAGVIMTFAPESTVTDQFIPTLKKHVTARRGTLRFIELRCSESEMENRLIAESRGKFGKLRDVTQFRQLDKAGAFARPKMPSRSWSWIPRIKTQSRPRGRSHCISGADQKTFGAIRPEPKLELRWSHIKGTDPQSLRDQLPNLILGPLL